MRTLNRHVFLPSAILLLAPCGQCQVPNWVNPLVYGAPSNGSTTTVSGTGSQGGTLLTLSAASDFMAKQGIMVLHGGVACGTVKGIGCSSPPTPTVTPAGKTGGTSYTYSLACIDGLGGVGPAGSSGSTATGNSSLSGTVTGTMLTGNYNVVKWTGNASCYEVAIYRNGALIGSHYSAPSGTVTFNDIGLAAWTSRDIPSSPPSVPLNDNYSGLMSSLTGTSAAISPALGAAVSSALVYHNDTPLIQAAINTSPFVSIPRGSYQVKYPIDFTGARTAGGADGNTTGVLTGNATLIMDTGDIGIDLTGDDNVEVSNLGLYPGPTNPTTVDLYCARDSTLYSGLAQNVRTRSLILETSGTPHALGGRGFVAFYNHGCEIQHNYDDQFQADRWVVLTADNVDSVSSLFDSHDIRGTASMSQVDFYSANGGGNVAAEIENGFTILFKGGYMNGGESAAHPWAFEFDPNTDDGRFTVEQFRVEEKGGLIDVGAAGNLAEPTINTDLYRVSPMLTTPQLHLNAGAAVSYAPLITIDDYGGSGANFAPIIDGTAPCSVSYSTIFIGIWQNSGSGNCALTGNGNTVTGPHTQVDRSIASTYEMTQNKTGGVWIKLGTWVATSPGITGNADTLAIDLLGGNDYTSGVSFPAEARILVRAGNSSSAPNLAGATLVQTPSSGLLPIAALSVVATGGSTSVNNQSWDIYIFEVNSFSGGIYSVQKLSTDQWIDSDTISSNPGSGSSSVYIGSVIGLAPLANPIFSGTIYGASAAPVTVQGGAGATADFQVKNAAGTTTNFGVADNGNATVRGSMNAVGGFAANGVAGFTGTKTAGSCVLTIVAGIITGVTGC